MVVDVVRARAPQRAGAGEQHVRDHRPYAVDHLPPRRARPLAGQELYWLPGNIRSPRRNSAPFSQLPAITLPPRYCRQATNRRSRTAPVALSRRWQGEPGNDPGPAGLETAALPVHHSPVCCRIRDPIRLDGAVSSRLRLLPLLTSDPPSRFL